MPEKTPANYEVVDADNTAEEGGTVSDYVASYGTSKTKSKRPKQKFKMTEVGLIPEGWEAKPLKLVLRGHALGGNYPNHERDSGLPLIKMGNIGRGNIEISKLEFIREGVTLLPKHRLVHGDLLFNTRNTLDLVGKVAIWQDELPLAYYNSNLLRLDFDPKEVCSHWYANYALNCGPALSRFRAVATGTTSVAAIYTRDLMRVPLAVPPPPEQQAIAAALSDVDALLQALDRLIVKKRDLKQAAMQELLTGKRRLPGFTGKWETKRLGECFDDILGGGTPRRSVAAYWNGAIPWVTVKDFASFNPFAAQESITPEGLTSSASNLIPRGTLILSTRMAVGCVSIYEVEVAINQDLKALVTGRALDPKFMFYWFVHRQPQVERLAGGSTVRGLSLGDLRQLEVVLPPERDEQAAIATVLSDMDAEIGALESRREKTKALKQGTMQELLTGRIRLATAAQVVVNLPVSKGSDGTAKKKHNWQINEAVVISVFASRYGTEEYPLTRKRYTKLSYLLHRHVEGRTEGYLKKAAGPYNPRTRYAGPEGIAIKSKYVRKHHNGTYEGFVAADEIAQAETYFDKWYGADALTWIERFHYAKTDELELLTTIDMAMVELRRDGKVVDLKAVKGVLDLARRSSPSSSATG